MFRNNIRDSDHDSSDDEGPSIAKMARGVVAADDEEMDAGTRKKHNVWADVVLEQQLDEVSKVGVQGATELIERGSESFAIPMEERRLLAAKQKEMEEAKEREKSTDGQTVPMVEVPIVCVSPAVDDPFAETADLTSVEGFGFDDKPVTSSKSIQGRISFPRGRGGPGLKIGARPPRGRHGCGPSSSNEFTQPQKHQNGAGQGQGSNIRGGRGGGGVHRGAGANRGNKRSWDGKNVLKHIVAPEYSLESLMTWEFDEGLSIQELGEQIGKALGEKDPTTVKSIVQALGEQKALQLFEVTRQKESQGGVMILDGSRRRSPGGAFIFLFKEDTSISQDIKDQIFQNCEKQDRQWKRAKRRGRREATFEDNLKEFSDKLKERHGMPAEGQSKEDVPADMDVKPLPDVKEVLKVGDVTTTEDMTVPEEAMTDNVEIDHFMGDEWD